VNYSILWVKFSAEGVSGEKVRLAAKIRFFSFILPLVILSSCDNSVIKKWYAKDVNGDCEITHYYFITPSGVGKISREGSGDESDSIPIAITYPNGTSVPADDANIEIVHTGVKVEAGGSWVNTGKAFIRYYTVSAATGAEKHYRVTATEGDSMETSVKGAIGRFLFTPTNGLIEGRVNTEVGAITGVFSDPDAGTPPFNYTLETYTDMFEIAVEPPEDPNGVQVLKVINEPVKAQNPWIVRVKVEDSEGNFYAGPVQFVVYPSGAELPGPKDFDFIRAPDGLWIHSAPGSLAGTFTPPKDGSGVAPFSYSFVDGGKDNDKFGINGSALSIGQNALLAEDNPYEIYVEINNRRASSAVFLTS
jgi:hypothetical protein